jgi:hypothetical protein
LEYFSSLTALSLTTGINLHYSPSPSPRPHSGSYRSSMTHPKSLISPTGPQCSFPEPARPAQEQHYILGSPESCAVPG